MNRQQFLDIAKTLTVAGGPLAVLITVITGSTDQTEKIIAALGGVVSIVGIVWAWLDARQSRIVEKAGEIPGVQVHANADPNAQGNFPVAPPEVIAVAQSSNGDVVPMTGGPVLNP